MAELREKEDKQVFTFKNFTFRFDIEHLVVIILIASILVSAILIKINISEWIYSNIGMTFTYTLGEPVNGAEFWYFEIYDDANYYYESYLDAFRNGWNPYLRYTDELDFYVYGPIFIYGLYFTSLLVQLFNPGMPNNILIEESVKWTAINFDALSAVMVYLIIINFSFLKDKKVYKHLIGIIGVFAFIFMPLNLLYVDTYYLNIPQMTFFTLLAFFLVLKKRYRLTAYSLTLAWLTKQMPLFLVIPIFSMIWKKYDLRIAVKKFLRPFLLSTLLLSIPWILITPHFYIGRILAAGRPLWYATLDPIANGHGTTLAHSFLYGGLNGLSKFYVWINTPMIPFIIVYGFSLFIGHFNAKKLANDETRFTIYITWVILISHTFISRGLFKYYDAFYTPFFILSAIVLSNSFIEKIKSLAQRRKERKSSKQISEDNPKTLVKIGLGSLDILLVLIMTLGIYYYSWVIMITVRFIHPALLVHLTLIISIFLPFSYYREIKKKSNYKQLKQDFIDFFKYIKQSIINSYKAIKKGLSWPFKKLKSILDKPKKEV